MSARRGRSQNAQLHQATVSGLTDNNESLEDLEADTGSHKTQKPPPSQKRLLRAKEDTETPSRAVAIPNNHTSNLAPRLALVNHFRHCRHHPQN